MAVFWKKFRFLHFFALDAPLIAVAWQEVFARQIGFEARWPMRIGLFAGVWLIYLLDRLADARRCPGRHILPARLLFAKSHERALVFCIGAAICLGLWAAFHMLPWVLLAGLLTALACFGYFLWNHRNAQRSLNPWLKEAFIGVIFAIGTVVGPVVNAPSVSPGTWGALGIFAGLCSLNCCWIGALEIPLDRRRGDTSLAKSSPTSLIFYLKFASWTLFFLCLLLLWFTEAKIYGGEALVAFLLALTENAHRPFSPSAWVDGALLAGGICLLFW